MAEMIGQAGRVRLSPLQQAIASQQGTPSGSQAGGSVSPSVAASTGLKSGDINIPPNEADVAKAIQDAQAGDETAMQWLADLGLIGGAAAGSVALHHLSGRVPEPKVVAPTSKPAPRYGTYDPNAAPIDAEFRELTPAVIEPRNMTAPAANEEAKALQNALKAIRRIGRR